MGAKKLFDIKGNEKSINKLTRMARQKRLVPFLGAGFSDPACPTWGIFLDRFFQGIKEEFLMPADEDQYLKLEKESKFEDMADFLVKKAERQKFEKEMKRNFDKPLLPAMKSKFDLLHRAFPGLKITTNFDCLIENNGAVSDVDVCYGKNPFKSTKPWAYPLKKMKTPWKI